MLHSRRHGPGPQPQPGQEQVIITNGGGARVPKTLYFAGAIENLLRGVPYILPGGGFFVGLFNGIPTIDYTPGAPDGAELLIFAPFQFAGYARAPVTFGAPSGGVLSNSLPVVFPTVQLDSNGNPWVGVIYWGLFDGPAADANLLYFDQLGRDEIVSLSMLGGPTGGTFTLNFTGQNSAPIPYNCTWQQLQAALDAMTQVGEGSTIVTGGAFPGASFVVHFTGGLGRGSAVFTLNSSGLTGGSSPHVLQTELQVGHSPINTFAVGTVPVLPAGAITISEL